MLSRLAVVITSGVFLLSGTESGIALRFAPPDGSMTTYDIDASETIGTSQEGRGERWRGTLTLQYRTPANAIGTKCEGLWRSLDVSSVPTPLSDDAERAKKQRTSGISMTISSDGRVTELRPFWMIRLPIGFAAKVVSIGDRWQLSGDLDNEVHVLTTHKLATVEMSRGRRIACVEFVQDFMKPPVWDDQNRWGGKSRIESSGSYCVEVQTGVIESVRWRGHVDHPTASAQEYLVHHWSAQWSRR